MIIKVPYFVLEVQHITLEVNDIRHKVNTLRPDFPVPYVKKKLKAWQNSANLNRK